MCHGMPNPNINSSAREQVFADFKKEFRRKNRASWAEYSEVILFQYPMKKNRRWNGKIEWIRNGEVNIVSGNNPQFSSAGGGRWDTVIYRG